MFLDIIGSLPEFQAALELIRIPIDVPNRICATLQLNQFNKRVAQLAASLAHSVPYGGRFLVHDFERG